MPKPVFVQNPRYPKNENNSIPRYGVKWSKNGSRPAGNGYWDKDVAVRVGTRLEERGFTVEYTISYMAGSVNL